MAFRAGSSVRGSGGFSLEGPFVICALARMISVTHLVKRYGGRLAVKDLSFEVGKGEVIGFLGPNGAGKSTTLRILAGFLGMTSGKVTVCGHDIQEEADEAKRSIGYMPEAVPLYPEMRVAEYLTFRAELKRIGRRERRSAVDDAMQKANVMEVANVLIGKLSKGYRQRVGLADALVARPPLLILDEPTAGLDPNQIREVRDVIRALGKEHTVLLSTHILSEVEQSCTKLVVIAKGKLVAQGTTEDIQRKRRPRGLELVVRGAGEAAEKALKGLAGVAKVRAERAPGESGGELACVRCTWVKNLDAADIGAATEKAVALVVAAGENVREVRAVGSSLEEVFAELTRGAAREDDDIDGAGDAKNGAESAA
jgi:ABC-2 type transport system ATP-binding protein